MKLSDEELVAVIESEERGAIVDDTSELANERAEALEMYKGEMPGLPVVEGRSGIVDRTLTDTIQWILPNLVRVFLGGEEIGRFNPVGPEDE